MVSALLKIQNVKVLDNHDPLVHILSLVVDDVAGARAGDILRIPGGAGGNYRFQSALTGEDGKATPPAPPAMNSESRSVSRSLSTSARHAVRPAQVAGQRAAVVEGQFDKHSPGIGIGWASTVKRSSTGS